MSIGIWQACAYKLVDLLMYGAGACWGVKQEAVGWIFWDLNAEIAISTITLTSSPCGLLLLMLCRLIH
jgi:hypothetical protein